MAQKHTPTTDFPHTEQHRATWCTFMSWTTKAIIAVVALLLLMAAFLL